MPEPEASGSKGDRHGGSGGNRSPAGRDQGQRRAAGGIRGAEASPVEPAEALNEPEVTVEAVPGKIPTKVYKPGVLSSMSVVKLRELAQEAWSGLI